MKPLYSWYSICISELLYPEIGVLEPLCTGCRSTEPLYSWCIIYWNSYILRAVYWNLYVLVAEGWNLYILGAVYIGTPIYTESGVLESLCSGCGVLEHEALMGAGWIAALDS
jgi:hypothetical protein